MSPTIDTSLAPLVGLLAFVIGIALYVWMALALSAMFRKMGEEAWKGWVPFLNQATVLAWGGFSPLLILLLLVPIVGQLAVLVLLIVSAHRINPGFGYGTSMTVVAAFLFIVWASILGFGPAPWRGARHSIAPAPPLPPGVPPAPPLPPLPSTSASFAASSAATGASYPAAPPLPPAGIPAAFPSPTGTFSAVPFPGAPSRDPLAAQPVVPTLGGWAPQSSAAPGASRASEDEPDMASWPSEIDDVSAVSPSPFPPSAAAPIGARRASSPQPSPEPLSDPSAVAPSGEPTAASDAVAPEPAASADPEGLISFVPGRRSAVPETPAPPAPVTRMPVTAPIETPLPSRADRGDEFPELSGEVSAVVGSPVAGAPLSARSSVSAQQRTPEAAEVPQHAAPSEDDVDQTVMVRRKKITWQLVPGSGPAVPLTGEVVVLGRRPAADAAFPQAQLVAVQDDARTVSKTHARLELRGEKWLVTDLGSTNGVLVRTLMGEEIEVEPGTELEPGERFFLGDEEFHLQHD
ncbi:MAG: DUF5684 domain-containing protein [Candidatus Microbacterium phytovorans]|uniref:DUF5684 domain-containing protein n=1 Tax=Candidatus Microbacterium phytovorans TaxID=3121374 RepID=A0AAJ5W2U5_9MICO|nr:FHA domain-containing protein [Microbacterium sp.]WEK13547.1 MAG: DUF5684 domain-containing protein [Microbacterium sp.]